MAFKVKILNMDAVISKVQGLFNEDVLRSDDMTKEIGDFTVDRIQSQTRSGKSLPDDNKSLKEIKDSTKTIRQKVEDGTIKKGQRFWFDYGASSPTAFDSFTPKKSQLTATGQLLDSLEWEKLGDGTIIVKPTGQRNKDWQTDNEITSNAALAQDLANRGFKFLGMDSKGTQRIKRIVLDQLRRFKQRRGFK